MFTGHERSQSTMVIPESYPLSYDLSYERFNRLPSHVLISANLSTNSVCDSRCPHFDRVFQLFCDFHGHSRQKNFFFYGNDPRLHFLGPAVGRSTVTKVFPKLFTGVPGFAPQSCVFSMRKQKEGCARIVVWDEFKIDLAYTMEATYNGFDLGVYKVRSLSCSDR